MLDQAKKVALRENKFYSFLNAEFMKFEIAEILLEAALLRRDDVLIVMSS